jgi:hypothetical protein
MPDAKISALTALTTPAADDELAIVDKSDTTQAVSGTTKRITVANLVSGGSSLTYPTLSWYQYWNTSSGITVGATSTLVLPLDGTDSAVLNNPASWTITAGRITPPPGVYAITWYWEATSGDGSPFDNFMTIKVDALNDSMFPTAPTAIVGGGWGSGSATLALGATASIKFEVTNRSGAPQDILNMVTVVRLDA